MFATENKHFTSPEETDLWAEEIYNEMRKIARHLLGWRRDFTLESREIVHEAWRRLCDQSVQNEEHRLRLTVAAMRQVVVDYMRKRLAKKRGGGREKAPLIESAIKGNQNNFDPLEVSDALTKLKAGHERSERVFVLHFYGALTHGEIADLMQISKQTVGNDWRYAKAFLRAELSHE